jgi:tryptophanyl-tRNA synthetase
VTDPGRNITFEGSSPGILNLLTIYEVLSGENRDEIEARFEGRGYGHLKSDLIDLLLTVLTPIRTKYEDLMKDRNYIDAILDKGAREVEPMANATLTAVHEVMGCGKLTP